MSSLKGFHIKGLRVRNSGIHGKGLFTRKQLNAGQEIGRCSASETHRENAYTLWMDEGRPLMEVTCKLKYINHSSSPNVVYYDDLSVVALRDIEPGEELTHHYGEDWD